MVEMWRQLTVPEGWRPQLTENGLLMAPPPEGSHNLVADSIDRDIRRVTPEGCGVFQWLPVGVATTNSIYIPDICVAPRAVAPADIDPVPASEVLLAGEFTSRSSAGYDRKQKQWAYARGGIPLYLLVDRFDDEGPTVSLFSQPSRGSYHRITRVPFGESIHIDPPFDLTLETADF